MPIREGVDKKLIKQLSDGFWDDTNSTFDFVRDGGTKGVRWAILDDTGAEDTDAWKSFAPYGTLGDPTNFYSFHNVASILFSLEDNSIVTDVFDNFSLKEGDGGTSTQMPLLVGKKLGLWLVEEDIYLTIKFTKWGSGGSDNSISYIRSTKD